MAFIHFISSCGFSQHNSLKSSLKIVISWVVMQDLALFFYPLASKIINTIIYIYMFNCQIDFIRKKSKTKYEYEIVLETMKFLLPWK